MKKKDIIEKKEKKRGKLERKVIITMIIIFVVSIMTLVLAIYIGFYDEKVNATYDKMKIEAEVFTVALSKPLETDIDEVPSDKRKVMLNNANDYASFIDGWLEKGADEHYEEVGKKLEELKDEYEYNDVFIYKLNTYEDGELKNDMVIVYDSPSSDDSEYKLGDDYGESKGFDAIKKVYETGRAATIEKTGINNTGLVLVAYAPIKYRDGTVCAVLGLEYSANKIMLSIIMDHYLILLNALVTYIVCGIFEFILIRRYIVKPVKSVSDHMNRFVSDKSSLEFEPITEIHTNDEIEQIADDFNSMAQSIIDYTKNLEIKTSEEERLKLDLDVTKQIRSVVSSEIAYPAFPERSDFDLFASLGHTMYNKCSFFNYFMTNTDHLFILLGESLGNSLSSMIFSMLSVSFVKSMAQTGITPSKIAFDTNNHLCSIEKKDGGMTVGSIIVDIDLNSGLMRYVNAGMPPILIKKPGEGFASESASQPFCLGQMHGISFEQKTIQLCQGTALLFTSFGITEMSNDSGTKYGIDRLVKSMNDISEKVYKLDDTVNMLENDLEKHRNNAPVSLDTAVVAFRYFG